MKEVKESTKNNIFIFKDKNKKEVGKLNIYNCKSITENSFLD
jgi:hypothetical protein